MPKQVDHGARRQQIIEALWRITVRGGLERASFRQVAAEAGVSVNLIQYYFGTKDDLLVAALEHLAQRVIERIQARTGALGGAPTERELIGAIFDEFFPDDDVSRTTMLLFIVFEAVALSHTGLARAEARQMTGSLYGNVARLLRQAQEHGRAPASVDPDQEAVVLVATLTSVSQAVLGGHLPVDEGRTAITYALDRALPATPT
ncbi:MAG TPA: TetR/AcrR family transcriptional regulator [Euzebyales bacterium]|nr:TetR/AcrR family transcriptional regulator [Euzebyales bacterium]